MMTTVIAARFDGDSSVCVAHVGDSRAYRYREGKLHRLTRDHTMAEVRRAMNEAPGEDAEMVARALGQEPIVVVTVLQESVLPGDVYILCSDGLYRTLDAASLLRELARSHWNKPQRLYGEVIDKAVKLKGSDNTTADLLKELAKQYPDDPESLRRVLASEADKLDGSDNTTAGLLKERAAQYRGDPQRLCEVLVEDAKRLDGSDNITVVAALAEDVPNVEAGADRPTSATTKPIEAGDDQSAIEGRLRALRRLLPDMPIWQVCLRKSLGDMPRWFWFFVGAAVLVIVTILAAGWRNVEQDRVPTYGALKIRLAPPELMNDTTLKVSLDGRQFAPGSSLIDSVRTRVPHTLKVDHPGYELFKRDVILKRLQRLDTVSVPLRPGVHLKVTLMSDEAIHGGELRVMRGESLVVRTRFAGQSTVDTSLVAGTYDIMVTWGQQARFRKTWTLARGDSVYVTPDAAGQQCRVVRCK